MSGLESFADRDSNCKKLSRRKQSGGNPLPQVLAFEQFHHEKRLPAVVPDIVQGADVRVIQRRSGLRLAAEAFHRGAGSGDRCGQNLQRHFSVQPGIHRLIHLAHAARSDERGNSIRT